MVQPFYPQQFSAPPPKKKPGCGVIALVVAVAAVPIMGILAALATYGFRRYIAAAKTAEARSTVTAIYLAAARAAEDRNQLCGSSNAVPPAPPNGKYIHSSRPGEDFQSGDETSGWACLRFSLSTASYYSYRYERQSADRFRVIATGDLDSDGKHSTFVLEGKVTDGVVAPPPPLEITNEFE